MVLHKYKRAIAAAIAALMLPINIFGVSAANTQTITIAASGDTYVEGGGGKASNYGSETVLIAKRQNQNLTDKKNDRAIYIKFDIKDLADTDISQIKNAQVLLNHEDSKQSSASVWAQDSAAWDEAKLTAETLDVSEYDKIESAGTFISDITAEANETIAVDMTDYIKGLLKVNKYEFTVIILGENKSSVTERMTFKVSSRETALGENCKPALKIEKKQSEAREADDAVDDAYVNAGNADKCFGTNDEVLIGNGNISLFKFDVPSLSADSVKSAKISLFAEDGDAEVKIYTAKGDFDGGIVTYNTMPKKQNLAATLRISPNERCEADVTGAVLEAIAAGDEKIIFAAESESSSAVKIASANGISNRPKLIIENKTQDAEESFENTMLKFSETAHVRTDGTNKDLNFGGTLAFKAGLRQGLVKIDISKIADTAFSKAVLSMYISDAETPGAITETEAYKIDSSWQQNEVTYNNTPQKGELIGKFNTKFNTWSRLDVTDYVKEAAAAGENEVSLLFIQNANPGRQMIVSASDSDQNPSGLSVYYPASDENMLLLADSAKNGWSVTKGEKSGSETELTQGGSAISGEYQSKIESLGADDWSAHKFVLKANAVMSDDAETQICLLKSGSKSAVLFRSEKGKIFTNTSNIGSDAPQNPAAEVSAGQTALFEAVIDSDSVTYYIDGKAAGNSDFTDASLSSSDAVGLYCTKGTVKFSDVELFGWNKYSGSKSFDIKSSSIENIDSMESVRLEFTTEIAAEEFKDLVSINGEKVDFSRISVAKDGKTLLIAPPEQGYDAYADNRIAINSAGICDIFGKEIESAYIARSFKTVGWELSAKVTGAERSPSGAKAEITIKNNTEKDANVSIMLVRTTGDDSGYMFCEKTIEKLSVSQGSEEVREISADGIPSGGVMKIFVYDSDTFEPILRRAYNF